MLQILVLLRNNINQTGSDIFPVMVTHHLCLGWKLYKNRIHKQTNSVFERL